MSNETKRDVFEVAMNHATKSGWIDYGEMMSRYATALPDDLPVIPKEVGEYIKGLKQRYPKRQLIKAFPMVYGAYNSDVRNWVLENSDTFALAWLIGVWRVEETGEIVKLEASK